MISSRIWTDKTAVARTLVLAAVLMLSFGAVRSMAQQKTAQPFGERSQRLVVVGSDTMNAMMTAIAKRFEALNPGVKIEVRSAGSARGLSDVRQARADIGMVTRALSDDESDLYDVAIARDGVCIIVHKDNPVQTLTTRQVIDIYTGRITNWRAVGGANAPITVLSGEPGRSASELFIRYFKIDYGDIKAESVENNPARIQAISGNRNATVYMSAGEAERSARAGAPIKLLAVDMFAPNTRSIQKGDYPISRALTLVTRDVPTGIVRDFINFSLSPQITDIVKQHDFVPYLD